MTTQTGGPAFPCETVGQDEHGEYRLPWQGMTLRDYFAAHALSGLVVNRSMFPQEWAEAAYEMADAMLAAREKGNEE